MRFTINTLKQTITIIGSFKYEDFKNMIESLPEPWKNYTIMGSDEPDESIQPIWEWYPSQSEIMDYWPERPIKYLRNVKKS